MQSTDSINLDYQHLFQSLPGLFLVLSPQLKVIAVTEDSSKHLKLSKEDLLGQPASVLYKNTDFKDSQEQIHQLQESLNKVIKSGQPHQMKMQILPVQEKEGNLKNIYWSAGNTPVFNNSGQLQYIIHEIKDITSEYLAQREASQSKERFEMVSQATNDAIWDWNLLENTVIWNDNYCTLFGHEQPDPTVNSWLHFIHPEDADRVNTSIHDVIDGGGKFWSDEYRFRCADGSYSTILDRGFVMRNSQKQAYRMMGSMQDITLQRKAENQVKESAEFFQFLANNVPAFIWTTTTEGKIDYLNKFYQDFIGLDDNKEFNFSELLPPDLKESVLSKWRNCFLSAQPFEMEVPIKTKNGEYRWTFARSVPHYNEAGEIIKWLGTATDIHVTKQAQLALEQSTQRFTFLADTVPAFIWTSNPDGRTDYRNKHYYDYIGFKPDIDLELNWPEYIHPEDRDKTSKAWEESVKTGQEFDVEQRLKAKDGTYNWFISRAHAMRNKSGAIIKWFGTSINIQNQKITQQQLELHDAQLQRVLDEAPVQLTILRGPNLEITYQNVQARQSILNRNILGLTAEEAWPDMASQGFQEIIQNVYLTGQAFVANECFAAYERAGHHDKTSGYFNFSYQPLRNINQEIEGVLCFSTDVTDQVLERQRAEALTEDLQHETEKFKILAEAVPQFVWAADAAGNTDYFNQRWVDYTGLPLESVVGENWGWLQVLHPEDAARTQNRWQKSIAEGIPYEIEYRLKAADGQFKWFLARGIPMQDNEGTIVRWLGTCTDINEQKLAQKYLEESTAQFQFLADTVPQLIWTTLPDGFHDYFNRGWTEFTGYTLQDSLGTAMWNNLLHPEDQEKARETWSESLTTGQDYQIEYRFKRASDGEWRWFLARAKPMRNEKGEIIRWFGTCTDIHEQKLIQDQLAETNNELKQINEDLDRFVYTASHDLKLPIINMGGLFEELMRTSYSTDPDHDKLVGMFHKSLDQIHTTITDLSEIAKVQKNINSETEEIDLAYLLAEVELSLSDQIKANQAVINKDLAIRKLNFSRVNLRSIFYNLISNALKYRASERSPHIHITTSQVNGYVLIQVKDNGLGINMERHGDKLFQMFKRFHNHVPGTGLGLYIVNRILQNNNGYIEVESNPGQGSTFLIYFKTP